MAASIQIDNQIKRAAQRTPLYADEPRTLAELFSQSAARHARPDALNYKKDGAWHSISSAEMVERAAHIALGLYSLGIRRGDRAVLLAANSPEWTLSDAGCQFAGIVDVPVYTTLASQSVKYIIRDSGARVFFLQNLETYERLCEILPECDLLEKLVFFDFAGVAAENAISLADLEAAGARLNAESPSIIDELREAVAPEDVATLIYTSGTTGEPKGVMLS